MRRHPLSEPCAASRTRLMRARREAGMTLLEVLLATMLLGVMASIIFSSFGVGLRAARLARGMTTAVSLADEAITQATAAPCAVPAAGPVPPATPPGSEPDRTLAGYAIEIEAHSRTAPNATLLRTTVRWTEGRLAREVTLVTYRHRPLACWFISP